MSTLPTPSPAPPSKLQNILAIINLVLGALSAVPVLGVPIAIEQAFQKILTNALQAYQQEAGLPIDLSKIPLEEQLPK